MVGNFLASAIVRLDGSDGDGVHLLWTAPEYTGYSIKGYDIQRRDAIEKQEITCVELTPSELQVLHQAFRFEKSSLQFVLRQASCPKFPDDVPDQPHEDGKQENCISLGRDDIKIGPNPLDHHGFIFSVLDHKKDLHPQTRHRDIAGLSGLDCGNYLNIEFPWAIDHVELTMAHSSRPAEVIAFDVNDKKLQAISMTAGKNEVEVLVLEADDIRRILIVAPQNETALFKICFPPSQKRCIDFSQEKSDERLMPWQRSEFKLQVFDARNRPFTKPEIVHWNKFRGLNCGYRTHIEFVNPMSQVELTLVHFSSAALVRIFDERGRSLGQKKLARSQANSQMISFRARGIKKIEIYAKRNELILQSFCFVGSTSSVKRIPNAVKPRMPRHVNVFENAAVQPVAGLKAMAVTAPLKCLAYEVRFPQSLRFVRVQIGVPGVLAIAFRDGKVVDAQYVTQAQPVQDILFDDKTLDKVVLYVSRVANFLRVCFLYPVTYDQEDREWQKVPYIARGIQLPIEAVNDSLNSHGDEINLAKSRLLGSESFAGASFDDLAKVMNAAAKEPRDLAPLYQSMLTREDVEDPHIEVRPWPLSLAMMMDAPWRRMLGFAYLDNDDKLVPSQRYDYRITGYFYRKDIEEEFYGFHTVPLGMQLPSFFYLDTIACQLYQSTKVSMYPKVLEDQLDFFGRKGIQLLPGFDDRSLRLTFSSAITHLVLELEPDAPFSLAYEAKTSDYFLGLTGNIFQDDLDREHRVQLKFDEPIDTLTLRGRAFLYGIRLYKDGIPSGDAFDVLPQSYIVYDVIYQNSPLPAPPTVLGTSHLQQPIIPRDPSDTEREAPADMGFQLAWLPPPSGAIGPLPWPEDLAVYPPFDVLGFMFERRQVDTGGYFEPLTHDNDSILFFGNRGRRREREHVYFGADLLCLFPEGNRPPEEGSVYMQTDDVLLSAQNKVADPGSLFQYRVFSVDAIGRVSPTATLGSIVRLEKHIAPPQPVAPQQPETANVAPAGVRGVLLQKSDPNLSDKDKLVLGTSTNAVVLQWGWTDQERQHDPYAKEFRVYWLSQPPDRINGQLTGVATEVAGLYRMSATMDQSVKANEMRGKYIHAGDYPFKVANHTAGTTIQINFEKSVLDATLQPTAASFVFYPLLDGDEQRPNQWQQRHAVIPITSDETYMHVFRDALTINANHPNVRVWVGVSSADDQDYVADEIPATQPNGGRSGNESSIVSVAVEGRYFGRPDFTPPPPLADVPEIVTDEPRAESVSFNLDLPGLLPSVSVPPGHRIMLQRFTLADLIGMIGVSPSEQITVQRLDGTQTSYTLANPSDHANFVSQIQSGEPGRIANKFLMDALIRELSHVEKLWQKVEGVEQLTNITDTVPGKAERYIYRVRLVDAAGHFSSQGAIVPKVVRVASIRVPAAPRFNVDSSADDHLDVEVKARDAFDNKWTLLFTLAVDFDQALDERTLDKAQLLRLPNRRDLYPNHGIRLRLPDGQLLAPDDIGDIQTATHELPDRVVQSDLNPGFDKRVAVWAVTMTRDGINSNFAGPQVVYTGPAPLVVPTLSVTSAAGNDNATWSVLSGKAMISVERSTDGGTQWLRVTPWLPSNTTQSNIVAVAGERYYRLVLKDQRLEKTIGPAFGPLS
jgi:hypothetical protein